MAATSALAQDDEEAARQRQQAQEAARQAAEARRQEELERTNRQRSIDSMTEFMRDVRADINRQVNRREDERTAKLAREREAVRVAFSDLNSATEELAPALASSAAVKTKARRISRSIEILLDFIEGSNKDKAKFDPSELKQFTRRELEWELLTSAELIRTDVALFLLRDSQSALDVNYLLSLGKLKAELLRLQWIARQLD